MSSVSAAQINQEIREVVDIEKDMVTEYVFMEVNLPLTRYYYDLRYSISSPENLGFEQTGGKECEKLNIATEVDESGNKLSYLTCQGEYHNGDSLKLKITHKCNCVFGNSNLGESALFKTVWLPNKHSSQYTDVDIVYEFVFPSREYYLSNSTIPELTLDSTDQGIVARLQAKLTGDDDSIYKRYYQEGKAGWFEIKKRLDFSSLKELKGDKYLILYPIKGFDNESVELKNEVEKIIPFVEKYGKITFKEIHIKIVPDKSLGEYVSGNALPDAGEFVNITSSTYNGSIVPHEICHLIESPFNFGDWFSEGQANNCARRYYESQGRFEEAKKIETDLDFQRNNYTISNYDFNLKNWDEDDGDFYNNPNITWVGYGEAYFLVKDIFETMDTLDISSPINTLRGEFYEDNSIKSFDTRDEVNGTGVYNPLGNDVLICKLQSATRADVIPIFKKYGFDDPGNCTAKKEEFILKYGKSEAKKYFGNLTNSSAIAAIIIYLMTFLAFVFLLVIIRLWAIKNSA